MLRERLVDHVGRHVANVHERRVADHVRDERLLHCAGGSGVVWLAVSVGDSRIPHLKIAIAHGGVCDVKQRASGDTHVRNVRVVSICPWWGV